MKASKTERRLQSCTMKLQKLITDFAIVPAVFFLNVMNKEHIVWCGTVRYVKTIMLISKMHKPDLT